LPPWRVPPQYEAAGQSAQHPAATGAGFATATAAHRALDLAEVNPCFDEMIACIENLDGYGVRQLPVITAAVSG
jgi:hypothetical protein